MEEAFGKERTKQVKKGKARRNLTGQEKIKIESKLHPTSIFDFFYRIRVRSNYDDPEMYIYGQGDSATAQSHYRNLLSVTDALATVLEGVVKRKIGTLAFQKLENEFKVGELDK